LISYMNLSLLLLYILDKANILPLRFLILV
jgi:hypothetical protein